MNVCTETQSYVSFTSDLFVKSCSCFFFFFFNDTATTEIYTLSLHDALPISYTTLFRSQAEDGIRDLIVTGVQTCALPIRSEEHTSELQSRSDLVCRLLLEIGRAHV